MSPLKVEIVDPGQPFGSQQAVKVKVILTNTGTEDLHILTWNSPLDDIVSDCFEVKVGNKKVPYDGPIVKRGAPTAKDYKVIKAGQSIEAEYVVSDAYDTTKPGTYHVDLKNPLPDVRPKEAKIAATLGALDFAPKEEPVTASAKFTVEKGPAKRLTLGAAARAQESKKKKTDGKKKLAAATLAPALRAPVLVGGTAARKAATKQAHIDGYNLCLGALANLANNGQYKEWFGVHTSTRFAKVKANYSRVKSKMESVEFTYNLSGEGCSSGVYAYTYKNTTTIWFCSAFWSAAALGTDSKAGTVLHEHTHSDSETDDHVYGQQKCRTLAITNPEKAVANADSHEYFAGG